jgi:hypothetical protein
VLASRSGEEWRGRYRESEEYQRYIQSRLGLPPTGPETAPAAADQRDWLKHKLPESQRQFGILARRYGNLVLSDRKTLGLAAVQSMLVGRLLALVFGTVGSTGPKAYSLLFFLGISSLWYGCNNAAKEIVKERPIYRLERDVNLSVASYVISKMALLSVVGLGQIILLYLVVAIFTGIPGGSGQITAMFVTMLAGAPTGLRLSAVSSTNDQASTLVPIALIPQILLAAVIVPDLPAVADLWRIRGSVDSG